MWRKDLFDFKSFCKQHPGVQQSHQRKVKQCKGVCLKQQRQMNILQSKRSAGHSNHTQTQAKESAGEKVEIFFKPFFKPIVTSHENITCC